MRLPPRLRTLPVLALVGANVLPLLGVLLLDWDLAHILLLYWAESAIIGAFAVVRMARGGGVEAALLVPFFFVHFGAFMAVHLIFLLALFGVGRALTSGSLLLPFLGLVASHFVAYRNEKEEGREVKDPLGAPYARIMVMHLTIVFGAFLIVLIGSTFGALLLLVALKTVVDLVVHLRGRRSDEASTTGTQAA